MYPFGRLLAIAWKAYRSPRQHFSDVGHCSFRAHPLDIDMFMEMNNGRQLTLYDLGRFDLSMKCGLPRVLKERRWGLVVAGASLRFRRRIRMFDKIDMRTRMVANDGRFFYFHQAMYVKGEPCSSLLARTGVTEKGKLVNTARVFEAMGEPEMSHEFPDWVRNWAKADLGRPWPPDLDMGD